MIFTEKNKISDEEYERIKKHIDKYLYVDLVMWRNELVESGNIYNRLFDLIDYELMRRNVEIHNSKKEGKSK